MSKKLDKNIIVEYGKMKVLRDVAKTMPNSQLEFILESVDRQWDKIITKYQPPKKKAFVTKF